MIASNENIACFKPEIDFTFKRGEIIPLQMEKRIRYINRMAIPVTILTRDGLVFQLPATPVYGEPEVLIIEINIDASSAVKIDTDQRYTGGTSTPCILASKFMSSNSFSGQNVCYRYTVPREMIAERQHVIYSTDLDLVVTTLELNELRSTHPYSSSKALNAATEEIDANASFSTIKIMIVDNSGIRDRRWVMCGNSPYAIDPIRSASMDDGVYVISNANSSVDKGRGRTKETYYSWIEIESGKFKDKPPLLVYATYEEALLYGNKEAQREVELKNIQHELAKAKLELERVKNEHENRRTLIEAETADQKMEREKKTLEIRDQYEERSNRRREQSDVMKLSLQWGAFAISVIGLVVSVLGHFKPKK